jgi:hypothetical protein
MIGKTPKLFLFSYFLTGQKQKGRVEIWDRNNQTFKIDKIRTENMSITIENVNSSLEDKDI